MEHGNQAQLRGPLRIRECWMVFSKERETQQPGLAQKKALFARNRAFPAFEIRTRKIQKQAN
jgi:hypothetical protein